MTTTKTPVVVVVGQMRVRQVVAVAEPLPNGAS